MQYSRSLAVSVATRSIWILGNQVLPLRRGLASVTASGTGTADPALHAGDYESDPGVTAGDPQGTENVARPPNKPPYPNASSPRLKSTEVEQQPSGHPTSYSQKRRISSHTAGSTGSLSLDLENVSCAGLDGTPWPTDKEKEQTERDKEEERVEDEQEYYKHHKASPLSEIEFADTRKPITRAMDGTADAVSEYGAGRDVIGWRPEQIDTAEEALNRAARIWKENAMRGDPDAPHSRVLRRLRGESF